jgi:hypothetical protein
MARIINPAKLLMKAFFEVRTFEQSNTAFVKTSAVEVRIAK